MSAARRALPRLSRLRVPVDLVCGCIAILIAVVAVAATIAPHRFALSVLVHMAAEEPMAEIARRDSGFVFVNAAAHYDGVYFYAIANDPFLFGDAHTRIDLPANRYGHPAYGWLAGLVSLGQVKALPYALVLLSVLSLFIAGFAASRLATMLGFSPWLGLAVGLNPGLIYAVTVDTAEALGAALIMTGLLAWVSGRRLPAAVLFVPLCFAKEPLLAVPVGLALWELVRLVRGAAPAEVGRRLLWLAPGPLLYALWIVWVRLQLGAFPFEQGLDRLSFPFTGWIETFGMASGLATAGFFEMQNGQAAVALMSVTLGAIVVTMVAALRFRTPVDPILLLSGALLLCLGWLPLLYPKDLIRIGAFWLLLLPYVLATRLSGRDAAVTGSSGTGTGR